MAQPQHRATTATVTAAMRAAAKERGDVHRMQARAGQSAALARAEPAAEVVRRVWAEAQEA